MTAFRLWAPHARQVELVHGDRRLPMARVAGEDDVFCLDEASVGPGEDYGFSAEGGPVRPDPRSVHQPHGVHGLSRVIDLEAYEWQDEAFVPVPWSEAIVYELHVGTFSREGTFAGAVAHLDHLVELGVTHVEVMPVAAFEGRRGWGYDGVALYAVHEPYGGPRAFQAFVDACHQRGLAVLLDVVYNHLGPSGNYLGHWGPYFTQAYRTPWGDAPNFDQAHAEEVRRFFLDNALHWLRHYHLDGLRLDAVQEIYDRSALHILEELAHEVKTAGAKAGRPWVLIGESDANDPRYVRGPGEGGHGLTAMWCDDLHHALHALLTGERVGYYADFGRVVDLAKALRQGMALDGQRSRYRRRRHGRAGTLSGEQVVVYLQNHDQVGNRPAGDRLTASLPAARVRVGAALVLLSRFVPMLFQGEEWASRTRFPYFVDHDDGGLREAVHDGRHREQRAFGWDHLGEHPGDPRTFASAVLDWEVREEPVHAEMLAFYKALIRLRRKFLAGPATKPEEIAFDEDARWVAFNAGPLRVVAHLGDDEVALSVEETARLAGRRLLLGEAHNLDEAAESARLGPWSVGVWSAVG